MKNLLKGTVIQFVVLKIKTLQRVPMVSCKSILGLNINL